MQIPIDWEGVPIGVNTYLHYWEYNTATASFTDEYLFFKGKHLIGDSAALVEE